MFRQQSPNVFSVGVATLFRGHVDAGIVIAVIAVVVAAGVAAGIYGAGMLNSGSERALPWAHHRPQAPASEAAL